MVSAFVYSLLHTLNKIYERVSSLPAIILVCMGFMKKLVRVGCEENCLLFNFHKKYFTKKSIFTEIKAKNCFGGHFLSSEGVMLTQEEGEIRGFIRRSNSTMVSSFSFATIFSTKHCFCANSPGLKVVSKFIKKIQVSINIFLKCVHRVPQFYSRLMLI